MNALQKYFERTGIAPTNFALKIGRQPSTITRVLRGEREPSVGLALDIERGTGGAVKVADLLEHIVKARRRALALAKAQAKRKR